jgi:hypothetical protein
LCCKPTTRSGGFFIVTLLENPHAVSRHDDPWKESQRESRAIEETIRSRKIRQTYAADSRAGADDSAQSHARPSLNDQPRQLPVFFGKNSSC